ncbi:MAG: hypothetical protein K2W96_24790 [Gemmataceae bacterium]|nr:hypothetical protein [Gemmataceae bacterium]
MRVDPAKTKLLAQAKHGSPLIGCRWSPDGAAVAASAQDNSVLLWSADLKAKTVLGGHKSWVRAISFAGDLLLTADWTGRIIARTWRGTPGERWSVAAHKGWCRALALSPDGKTLASCGNDHLVKLWSLPDGKHLSTLEGHESHTYNVAFHPSGKALASADLKGNVKHWALPDGTEKRTLDAKILHKYDAGFGADIGGVRSMAFDAAGKRLACAGITNVTNAFAGIGNPLIVLLDWETGKPSLLRPRAAFNGTMWGTTFHPSGFVLGAAGGNGGVLWSWEGADLLSKTTTPLPGNARDLSLHPDGRRLAIPFNDGSVRVYEMATR